MKKVLLNRINNNNSPISTSNSGSVITSTNPTVLICSLETNPPSTTILDEPKLVPIKREEAFPLISLDQTTQEKIPAKRGRKTNQERLLIRQQQQTVVPLSNFQTPVKNTSKLKRRTHYISDEDGASDEEENFSSEDDYNDSHLKEEEEDGKLYCICKTRYNKNLWMIGCDECDEWFHGKCLKITALEARKIKKFICPKCSAKTGKQTTFKETKRRKSVPQVKTTGVDSPPLSAEDANQIVNIQHQLEMLSSSSPETHMFVLNSNNTKMSNNNIVVTLDH